MGVHKYVSLVKYLIYYVLVGILFLNRDAYPEERAALSEALYHALKDFLTSVKDAIAITTNHNRLFEAVVLSDSI